MPRLRTAAVVGLAAVPLLGGAFMLQPRATRDSAQLFGQVLELVSSRFVDTVDTGALYEKAARGLVEQLDDPYAALYSPKELRDFTATTGGRYGGIGMLVEDQEGVHVISRVFPNTPAAEAGIMEGDRIVAVDTATVRGWKLDKVTDALKGVPGTAVMVTFAREGVAQPIKAKFTRAIIRIPAVPYAIMLDGGIGYIPLLQFNETASEEMRDALLRLRKEGARGIVLDFRGNGGGMVDEALTISNYFLPQGAELMSTRGRAAPPQRFEAAERPIVPATPLVVLTDGGTASASEIVAGALQDHDRALIVGTTSFGKGLEQSLFRLDGGYALKLTTAKWYTPSGRSIHRDRKLVDGRLIEVKPDSLENDSVKKSRPVFKSDAGRVVYGGGGITPDVIVRPDTLTDAEQAFVKAVSPKSQQLYLTLYRYAFELKSQVKPDFTVQPAWREELYRRLQAAGVTVDRATYDAASRYVNEMLENRVAHFAFGDSTVRRRSVSEDTQLARAVALLKSGQTQQDLFQVARREEH
ncbi:MAG TPA: S41 family peptidase [Gemmatimonadaceae bacterium]|nr:S41 family peptidase [Gemmatimonadaceae bacterium]